ncbi:variable surface protein [Plasmodium gonderi]|uniref:Variable surface protein n=1 Tax=Plasmodium gonderi TaxID=77519 RepID=A0A1Y1JS54_PLAGO|nr:variable surface protein [Plasmodium gonderi]GAW84295.1 variable surface protein [Plasmodium gonderi]
MNLDEGDFYNFATKITNLKNANSYKKYVQLEQNNTTVTDHDNICKNLNINNSIVDSELLRNIRNNAKKLNSVKCENEYKEDCSYYKYWIFREIWKLYKIKKTSHKISDIIKEFMKLNICTKKNDNKKYSCQYYFTHNNEDELKYFLEQKNLFDYFKSYDKIISLLPCNNENNTVYMNYLKYINETYNKHLVQEECCYFGASLCQSYFLSCDDMYNPSKLIALLQSSDKEDFQKILDYNLSKKAQEESSSNTPKIDMYIKYLGCAKVTKDGFNETAIVCEQPGYRPHLKKTHIDIKRTDSAVSDNSNRNVHQLEINEKPINVVLISNQDYNYKSKSINDNINSEDIYTLFPEITGDYRVKYEEESKISCNSDHIDKSKQMYCRRSKIYKKLLNRDQTITRKNVSLNDILDMKDLELYNTSIMTNNLKENILFRIVIMIILSLGVIMIFFIYYKVKNFTPFGSLLKKKIGKSKINKSKFKYNAENHTSTSEHIPKNMKLTNKRAHLAYNTAL